MSEVFKLRDISCYTLRYALQFQSVYKGTESEMMLTWNLNQQLNLTKETKQRQKNWTVTSCRQIVTLLSFLRFMADLEQSGRIVC